MKKSLATRALKGLVAALLCCCTAPALGGVMLVDFELPEGVEAGSSLSGGPDGASVANSSSSKKGAAGGTSSDGTGGSAQRSSSSTDSSGGSGGSGAGGGSGPAGIPTQPTGGSANNGGTTSPAAGPGTESGNGGVGPGGDIITDPVILVSQSTDGGDHGPSVSTDPTFSYPPLSIVRNEEGAAPSIFAANLDDSSAAVDPGASAPEASAVIIWAVLGTTAAFGCKLRRRSAR